MSPTEVVLALDLGGTTAKGAVHEVTGRLLHTASWAVPAGGGAAALATVVDGLRELRDAAAAAGRTAVGAGLVVPGVLDEPRGRVVYASNLAWRDVAVADLAATALGIPVALGHDVRSAAVAEATVGAARGLTDFVLVTLGTGIACAICVDGRVRVGAAAAAGEFGHIPVWPDGEACNCGQHGCLEAYASGASVARRYAAAGGPAATTTEQIAARLGRDPLADRVWADATRTLALGLVHLTLLLDPALVLLGGGVARAGAALLDPTLAALRAGLAWREPPPVVLSPLGAAAGRVGAAVLGMRAAGRAGEPSSWTAADVTGGTARPTRVT